MKRWVVIGGELMDCCNFLGEVIFLLFKDVSLIW